MANWSLPVQSYLFIYLRLPQPHTRPTWKTLLILLVFHLAGQWQLLVQILVKLYLQNYLFSVVASLVYFDAYLIMFKMVWLWCIVTCRWQTYQVNILKYEQLQNNISYTLSISTAFWSLSGVEVDNSILTKITNDQSYCCINTIWLYFWLSHINNQRN